MGMKGIVASTAGLSILLNEGIGDTIRVSLTPDAGRRPRARRSRSPSRSCSRWACARSRRRCRACPGCGRTTSTFFQEMAQDIQGYLRDRMPVWRERVPGRRGAEGRRHGLRGQRPGRVEARRHRHLAAGHVRGAGRPGVHRRRAHRTLRGDGLVDEFKDILEATSTAATRPTAAADLPRSRTPAQARCDRPRAGRRPGALGPRRVLYYGASRRPPRDVGDPHVFL